MNEGAGSKQVSAVSFNRLFVLKSLKGMTMLAWCVGIFNMTTQIAAYNVLCAIIAAKWGMDYGVSQFRQLVFGFGGLLFGPLVLLLLYVSMLNKAKKEGKASARLI